MSLSLVTHGFLSDPPEEGSGVVLPPSPEGAVGFRNDAPMTPQGSAVTTDAIPAAPVGIARANAGNPPPAPPTGGAKTAPMPPTGGRGTKNPSDSPPQPPGGGWAEEN